jgi:hypothetical protein
MNFRTILLSVLSETFYWSFLGFIVTGMIFIFTRRHDAEAMISSIAAIVAFCAYLCCAWQLAEDSDDEI